MGKQTLKESFTSNRAGSLFLGPNNLTASIPDGIFGLSQLVHLYIDDCNLVGQVSSDIGNLSNLQALALNGNALHGEISHSIGTLVALGESSST